MNFKKTMVTLAIGSVGIVGAMNAHAVAVNNGDTLSIAAGVAQTMTIPGLGTIQTDVLGSYFAMDTNGDGITGNEKVALSQGSTGIVIGAANTSVGQITTPWSFFSATGADYVTTAVTGSTEAGLNLSGWTVTWNGIAAIPMGGGMQNCGTTGDGICVKSNGTDVGGVFNNGSGIATFAWNGVDGGAYTLDYDAYVPQADPSNFGGVHYQLHLEGNVTQAAMVPEASTYGMMLAGLGLVGFAVRRRKSAI